MQDLVQVMNRERVLIAIRARHLQDLGLADLLAVLRDAGFRWLSFDAQVLDRIRSERVDLTEWVWGVSDVTGPEPIRLAEEAGAAFLVTRYALDDVAALRQATSLPIIWTGSTVTELARGVDHGAVAVRLYPVAGMDAIRWVRRLQLDFAEWPLVLAGGIHFTNARKFLEMDVAAVELDDAFFDPHVMASGHQALLLHARAWARHLHSFRGTEAAPEV